MMSGYRLIDLEVFNWGTFDAAIRHLPLDGHSCLLTGENGTGKSTLIDAFLSLLVPNKRRSYNMSSGSARRERNETTYVRGAYQREKTRLDQIQIKYLRDEQSLSALAAHFINPLTKDKIILAQFFWFESSELRKCLVISHDAWTLQGLLENVRSPADLRYQLKQRPYTTIFSSFSEYQDYFVRYVGLRSSKGLDLFNQVSTIKQIGDLNEFVRQNMLEEADLESILYDFFHTFEDLTLAHQAIINARLQIEALHGLDKEARKLSETTQAFDQTTRLQTYLPRYFSAQQHERLVQQQQQLTQELAQHHAQVQSIEQRIDEAKHALSCLTLGLEGQGREDRLNTLHRELNDATKMHDRCLSERKKLETVRRALGLNTPLTLERFTQEQHALSMMKETMDVDFCTTAAHVFSLQQKEHESQQQLQLLSEDLLTTQKNKTLMPSSYLELRRLLCDELGLATNDLLYAAELMAVKDTEASWRLAAEKILRPLALKLLVPEAHFMQANQFIRKRNIGMKIVLQRIDVDKVPSFNTRLSDPNLLMNKLEFLPHAKQTPWLIQHIWEQFDYLCVDEMQSFQSASRAVTKEGLIKRHHHISEKDDRNMSHAQYLLGWAHEDKVQRLTEEIKIRRAQWQSIQYERQQIEITQQHNDQQRAWLAQRQLFDAFELVDTSQWEKKIKALTNQRESLIKQPESKEISIQQHELKQLAYDRDEALALSAVRRNELEKIPLQLERLSMLLQAYKVDEVLDQELKMMMTTLMDQEKQWTEPAIEGRLAEILRAQLARLSDSKHYLGLSLVRKMGAFKAKFPESTIDIEASLDDLPAFLQRYQTLTKEALPTHEARFKKLISKSVITDLTAFKSTLELSAEQIKESIDHLNSSLKKIAYSETSYVQIGMTKTKNPEIREFQAMLRSAIQTKGERSAELDLDESFLRIQHMISRLKNDMKWSARVTDVRNWTDFFVVEFAQASDEEISYYSDSSGLSGGQKAKLAFTILASALAYQYGLHRDTAAEKSFRFVMIDEAFSKSDDRNSQYALELFRQLGLQLLVVTPLDKLEIIKPYIQRIFVTQIASDTHRSRLAMMSITPTADVVAQHG